MVKLMLSPFEGVALGSPSVTVGGRGCQELTHHQCGQAVSYVQHTRQHVRLQLHSEAFQPSPALPPDLAPETHSLYLDKGPSAPSVEEGPIA